jgi:hypothetical protein
MTRTLLSCLPTFYTAPMKTCQCCGCGKGGTLISHKIPASQPAFRALVRGTMNCVQNSRTCHRRRGVCTAAMNPIWPATLCGSRCWQRGCSWCGRLTLRRLPISTCSMPPSAAPGQTLGVRSSATQALGQSVLLMCRGLVFCPV